MNPNSIEIFKYLLYLEQGASKYSNELAKIADSLSFGTDATANTGNK